MSKQFIRALRKLKAQSQGDLEHLKAHSSALLTLSLQNRKTSVTTYLLVLWSPIKDMKQFYGKVRNHCKPNLWVHFLPYFEYAKNSLRHSATNLSFLVHLRLP